MRDKSCAWMSEPRQSPPPPLSRLPGRQHGPLEVLEQPPRLPATVRKIERLLAPQRPRQRWLRGRPSGNGRPARSEEHTSELQSRGHLVCRLLLEKKKQLI